MADEVAKARVDVWKYAFGFNMMEVVKCAIELEIPDVLEARRGSPMTLSELSTAVGCPQSSLFRIMRFLAHHGIFKLHEDQKHYVQTPLSHLLTRKNMAPFVLLHANHLAPWSQIIVKNLQNGGDVVKESFSEDIWNVEVDDALRKLFVDSMSCHSRFATSAIIDNYGDGFKGIRTLVDVGGNMGTAIGMLVKAFPWIRGINFDLPKVVAEALPIDGIEHVGGSMFERVPKADAVMLMWILHDWSDDSCIDILKKCKEAVPSDSGKVMIVEAVIDEEGEGDEFKGARLALDMVIMAGTVKGKERTAKEWGHLLNMAGFSRHDIININAIEFVIVAYP